MTKHDIIVIRIRRIKMNNSDNQNNQVPEPQLINNPFANMSKKTDELKKQKNKTKLILIISITLITLLLGYIAIDKIKDSTKKPEPQSKENLEEVATELMEFIEQKNLDSLDVFGKNELLRVAINDVCAGVYECKIVDAKEVSNYIKEVFNKEVPLTDINCEYSDGVLYAYDANTNTYNYTNHNHTQVNTTPIYTKLNTIKKKNDKYILTLNKLYYSSKSEYITSDPLGINTLYNFTDYDMPSDSGPVLDVTKLISDYDNNFTKLKDKGNKYVYTFSKQDKKYYLAKYENIQS